MSGFTRDTKHYGDRLVYEALLSKWGRYHARWCERGEDWLTEHAEPAGFTVVRRGSGFVALVGPGLTDNVDEQALTTNALWEAVTGFQGDQHWPEPVRVIDRSPQAEAERKAANDAAYADRRARSAAAKKEPLTGPQRSYLTKLADSVDNDRFDTAFITATKGTTIAARKLNEEPNKAITRLTKHAARKMITELVGK